MMFLTQINKLYNFGKKRLLYSIQLLLVKSFTQQISALTP